MVTAGTVEYTILVADRVGPALRRIVGASEDTRAGFERLTEQSYRVNNIVQGVGEVLSALGRRMDLLCAGKQILDPIDPRDISQLQPRATGTEILSSRIGGLHGVGSGGGLKHFLGEFTGGLERFVSPRIIASGLRLGVKNALRIEEDMAKVNITAQLDEKSLKEATERVREITARNKADITLAPGALEQIISQTGDLDLSLSILDATQKSAKAQFAGQEVVAGALARTLSIVGKEKATAQEVLDTFVEAKRIGAGEFEDFARYMPDLIAGADALGYNYKEVAGVFAYMTGKGQSAERTATLMNNLYSVLGRGEVVEKMGEAGIKVFDNAGNIRSTLDIFKEVEAVTASMSDEQKSGFIENFGIVDEEAKSAFIVMSSDVDKLASSLLQVADSTGATDRAIGLSSNTVQRVQDLWNIFSGRLAEFGTAILPALDAGITILSGALYAVGPILSAVTSVCGWLFESLADGNPILIGLTASIGALGVMLAAHKIKVLAVDTVHKITAAGSTLLAGAIKLLNAAFVTSPVGWIALGIGALAGVIAALTGKTDDATKSFAGFNTELAKSKDVARADFDAAMLAATGSAERAEAIERINTQYGSYLPALLTETASNDDLRDALDRVNVELERKLMNKFRDQALGDALADLDETRTKVFENLIKKVDDGQKLQFAGDFNRMFDKMKDGEDWQADAQTIREKYNIGGFWEEIGTAITQTFGQGDTGPIARLWRAMGNYNKTVDSIKLLYTPVVPDPTADTAAGTSPKDDSGTSSEGGKEPNVPTYEELMAAFAEGKTGSNGGGGSPRAVFDLDSIAVNQKGTSAYAASVAKLGRIKLAGLTAAASLGIGMVSPVLQQAATMPDIAAAQMPAMAADATDYRREYRKHITAEKFCDQVVIHIAHADDKGMDEIREEITNVLMEVLDGEA